MMPGAPLTGSGGFTPSLVDPGPGPTIALPPGLLGTQQPAGGRGAAAAAAGSPLAQQFLGGVNPFPFVVALVAMGGVMLAYPKAAVPLAVIIVLGALAVDRQALTAFDAWQKGQRR